MNLAHAIRTLSACGVFAGILIQPAWSQGPREPGTRDGLAFEAGADLVSPEPSHPAHRRPQSGSVSVLRFAALSGLKLSLPESAPQLPVAIAVGAAPPGAVFPPGGGAALPPWIRTPVPPGLEFTAPARMGVQNEDWMEATRLHDALDDAQLDDETHRAVELPWPWLAAKQQELFAEGQALDAEWDAIFPGIRAAVNEYIDGYWKLKETIDEWQKDVQHYTAYCARTVPPEDLDRATRECAGIWAAIDSRRKDFIARDAELKSVVNTLVAVPMARHNAKIEAYLQKVRHWTGKVLAFNQAASEALSHARKPDIRFIDRLVKKYKLDKCQRRRLHDEITGQNLSDEEIESIARELGATGRGRCRPNEGA